MTTKTEEYFVAVTYLKLNLLSKTFSNSKLLWLNFLSQQTTVKGVVPLQRKSYIFLKLQSVWSAAV